VESIQLRAPHIPNPVTASRNPKALNSGVVAHSETPPKRPSGRSPPKRAAANAVVCCGAGRYAGDRKRHDVTEYR
jgi:hypothetical protein